MNLITETPFWLPTGLLLIGAILFLSGNARQQRRLMRGGVAAAALGILLALLSWVLESPREKVTRLTRELVAAVADRDWPALGPLLDDRTRLEEVVGRDRIIALGKRYADNEALAWKTIRITGLVVEPQPPAMVASLRVLSEHGGSSPYPIQTQWRFRWVRSEKTWVLDRADLHEVQGLNVREIVGRYFSQP